MFLHSHTQPDSLNVQCQFRSVIAQHISCQFANTTKLSMKEPKKIRAWVVDNRAAHVGIHPVPRDRRTTRHISTDRLAYKQNNTNRQAVVVAVRRRFGTFAETWQPKRFSRANPISGDKLWAQ